MKPEPSTLTSTTSNHQDNEPGDPAESPEYLEITPINELLKMLSHSDSKHTARRIVANACEGESLFMPPLCEDSLDSLDFLGIIGAHPYQDSIDTAQHLEDTHINRRTPERAAVDRLNRASKTHKRTPRSSLRAACAAILNRRSTKATGR
jgi:hypothetical protein